MKNDPPLHSPRTLQLKMLNANSFFTLDDDLTHDFASTNSEFRQNIGNRREKLTLYIGKTN